MQNGYRAWSRQPLPTMGDSNGGSVVANITSGTFLSLCAKKIMLFNSILSDC